MFGIIADEEIFNFHFYIFYSAFQTEKHVIKAIADDNRTLTLETPLAHRHLGQTYRIGNSTYDMRAEVGLLTRNIRIRGEKSVY